MVYLVSTSKILLRDSWWYNPFEVGEMLLLTLVVQIGVRQSIDCNSNLGHKYILIRLSNSFMHYLLLTHTTFMCKMEAVFLVNVITHTDTAAISA